MSKNNAIVTTEISHGSSSSSTSTISGRRRDASNVLDHEEAHPLKTIQSHDVRESAIDVSEPPTAGSRSPLSQRQGANDEENPRHLDVPSATAELPQWTQHASRKKRQSVISVLERCRILALWRWMAGPSTPHKLTFTPIFPRWQTLPSRWLSKILPAGKVDIACYIVLCVFWLTAFSAILATSALGSIGQAANRRPLRLSCTTALWDNAPYCGIDGRNCQPFEEDSFPFLCPSNCRSAEVLNPYTVGDQEIIYRSLVIGGPNATEDNVPVYRGDSFICGAAVHAGVVSNRHGGCGLLTRQGERKNYASTERNGILSIGFPSNFPLSFSIDPIDVNCQDPQWSTFAVSICATVLMSLLVSSVTLVFPAIFVILFFQVGLVSNSPNYTDFANVISAAFARFLPAAFIAVVLFTFCVKRTLKNVKAPWERTILWLGGCWVGALNNYTFDKIPIQRLTARDLKQQPGAITALVIIVIVILLIAIGQIWMFRQEGRLLKYLGFYCVLGIVFGCLAAIPALDFRLHHYILALILLPGTSIQTRPSLLYQGLLVGLFINGIARWGFDSILQTPAALLGDGQLLSALPQNISHNITGDIITFSFANIARGFDGMSVLVNDVERFQKSRIHLPAAFNWTRTDPDEPLFFRFAFTGTYSVGGIWYGDYTKPGIWYANGTWHEMLPGPS